MTIGIADVACLAASAAGVLSVSMMSTCLATSSAARAGASVVSSRETPLDDQVAPFDIPGLPQSLNQLLWLSV